MDGSWNFCTSQQAEVRVEAILDALLAVQALQASDPAMYGIKGMFYHFMDASGARSGTSEVSVVDTALLVAGAIVAGEYFGGDSKTKADQLYANIDWRPFVDEVSGCFRQGWKPDYARGFTIPFEGGYLSKQSYNTPTDEALLISLLAIGNHPEDEAVLNSYFAYDRVERTYTARTGINAGEEYTLVNSYFGSLFTYVYAHCFFDFESLGEDSIYFAPDPKYPESINWWDNSVAAYKAARQFCIDESDNYPFAYSETRWGISAVQRPDGRYEGVYGSVPFVKGPLHEGVIACYGMLSSMPFFRTAVDELPEDNIGIESMFDTYWELEDKVIGQYGFVDSFDNEENFSVEHLGIDQGPIVLMMENYRTGFVWNYFKQNEKIALVSEMVFGDSFDWIDVAIKNISDNESTNVLSFGDVKPGGPISPAEQYLELSFLMKESNRRVVMYSDNANNDIPYTGDGLAAGLVGTQDPSMVVPLQWAIFDEPQVNGYVFVDDGISEMPMQDVSDILFDSSILLDERTLVDGNNDLADYPLIGRITQDGEVYVYLGADFSVEGLTAQEYTTKTITFEVYQES